MKAHHTITLALGLALCAAANAQHRMSIRADRPGAPIQETMYGIFFEDINYAADGGLYGELVKNRSFEFPERLMGWNVFGSVELRDDGPFERNPHYVRLHAPRHREMRTMLENEGFFGIGAREGADYRFTVWARGDGQRIRVELVDIGSGEARQAVASVELETAGDGWRKYEAVLTPARTVGKARLRIFLESAGPLDLEHVSLFPADTWKDRENGLRKDLAQALCDIGPGVFRFPGGCIVEGVDYQSRYQWKNTVGPVENRPLNDNRWSHTMLDRFCPDYFQSGGLGFYEYFLLSEDMGAEPLPVLNCGMICQYQNEDGEQPDISALDPFIEDALDLIEFANGGADSHWGKVRADMGHPEPFGLHFIAIGNEQWGPGYPERLERFIAAIRKEHPGIKIVGSSGPSPDGERFDYLWGEMARLKVDMVDEHYYKPEEWFLSQGRRYDGYDRKGPKVFVGEYACHGKGKGWNHFGAALMEAALMTGLERNADVVHMATYAPLLAHAEGWQWRPDLVWFDNLGVARTCSYHVQRMFSTNRGTNVLPLTMDGEPVTGQDGLYASAAWDAGNQTYIVKVVNTSDMAQEIALEFKGLGRTGLAGGKCVTLHSDDLDAENTVANPETVVPRESDVAPQGNVLATEIGANTLAIYTLGRK